jgi:hypothetical protein
MFINEYNNRDVIWMASSISRECHCIVFNPFLFISLFNDHLSALAFRLAKLGQYSIQEWQSDKEIWSLGSCQLLNTHRGSIDDTQKITPRPFLLKVGKIQEQNETKTSSGCYWSAIKKVHSITCAHLIVNQDQYTLTLPSRCSAVEQLSINVWAITDRQESTMFDLWISKINSGFLMMLTQNRSGRLK